MPGERNSPLARKINSGQVSEICENENSTRRPQTRQTERKELSNTHFLRMPEHHLVRRVLLNCIKSTKETLLADVPNVNIAYAMKMSEDRELWRSSRPSLRRQPLQ